MTARDLGKALCLATGITCALLHAATFLTVVPGLLILVPFFLMMGAILCARVAQGWKPSVYRRTRSSAPTGKTAAAGFVLLVYAVLLFMHFYKSSGGASSVGIVDGRYVYMSKRGDPANIRRGIYNVPHSSREDNECVDRDDGNVLPIVSCQSGERFGERRVTLD